MGTALEGLFGSQQVENGDRSHDRLHTLRQSQIKGKALPPSEYHGSDPFVYAVIAESLRRWSGMSLA